MGITGYAGVILAAVVIAFGCQVVRRVRLLRRGGVHVALRRRVTTQGRGWQLGVGRYRGDDFEWYRVLSVRSGPDEIIPRGGLTIADRREPHTPDSDGVPFHATVLRCQGGAGELELAMDTEALTGFLSWLEAAPPGRAVPWMS